MTGFRSNMNVALAECGVFLVVNNRVVSAAGQEEISLFSRQIVYSTNVK